MSEDHGEEKEIKGLLAHIAKEEKKVNDLLADAKLKISEIQKRSSEELVLNKEKNEEELKSLKSNYVVDQRKKIESKVSEILAKAEENGKGLSAKELGQKQIEELALGLIKQ